MENKNAPKMDPQLLPLCDIVMEGAVTSGIIYPKAVVELARRFRLKNIGGTSVGALAAAITAAAELGRLRDPDRNPGYVRLAKLPESLSSQGYSSPDVSRLFDLFQAQSKTRSLFDILVASLNRGGKWDRFKHVVLAALREFSIVFWSVVAVVLGLQWLFGHGGGGTGSWLACSL